MADPVLVLANVHVSYRFVNSANLKRQLAALLTRRKDQRTVVREVNALRGVSFTLERGQTLGIIGANGAGKTTLLKTIAGIFEPNRGQVALNAKSVSLLALGVGFQSELTGVENIYINGLLLGLSRRQIAERMDDIVEFAGVGDAVENPLKTFSSGMRSRLAFATAVHVEPELLLIDEVLGVGDESFRKQSRDRIIQMIEEHGSVVIASHSMSYIRQMCDVVLWLDAGSIQRFGPTEEVVSEYLAST